MVTYNDSFHLFVNWAPAAILLNKYISDEGYLVDEEGYADPPHVKRLLCVLCGTVELGLVLRNVKLAELVHAALEYLCLQELLNVGIQDSISLLWQDANQDKKGYVVKFSN